MMLGLALRDPPGHSEQNEGLAQTSICEEV